MSQHVLLLAGTREARDLAERLVAGGFPLTVSLAGRTRSPETYPGTVRVGGFGGADGLAAYLRREKITALIDATHPFASVITANAALAAMETNVQFLRLQRTEWRPRAHDVWTDCPSLEAALDNLPSGARALLTTGAGTAPEPKPGRQFVLRSIEPVPGLDPDIELIRARPPFNVADEMALMRHHGITHLVTRNSGGASGREKLDAAASLGVEVLMIARPPQPKGLDCVADVADAEAWLRRLDTPSIAAP